MRLRTSLVILGLAVLIALAALAHRSFLPFRRSTVTIHGALRAGEQPVPGVGLEFISQDSGRAQPTIYTGVGGEYSVTVRPTTAYRVRLYALKFVPIGSFPLTTSSTDERIDFGIANTHVSVVADPPASQKQAWQLSLYATTDGLSGGPDLSGVLRPDDLGRDIVGLAPGEWRMAVDSPPDSAGVASYEIHVQPGVPVVVKAQVARRTLTLVPRDPLGGVVQNAVAYSAVKQYRQDLRSGEIHLTRVSTGMPVIVVATGFAPTCLLAPHDDHSPVSVALARADKRLTLTFGSELTWPIGLIRGTSDQCLIPARFYDTLPNSDHQDANGRVTIRVTGEHYEFRALRHLDEQPAHDDPLRGTGTGRTSLSCGEDYPVSIVRAIGSVTSAPR